MKETQNPVNELRLSGPKAVRFYILKGAALAFLKMLKITSVSKKKKILRNIRL